MEEKYKVNWPMFSEHLSLMFKDLYQEKKFADLTLISDDQTQFKVHKIVLMACSPIFEKIIESSPSQHPLIYLRGVQSYEMESILQFMYLGEATLLESRIEEFIRVVADLQVKKISESLEKINEMDKVIIDNDEPRETIDDNFEMMNEKDHLTVDEVINDNDVSRKTIGGNFQMNEIVNPIDDEVTKDTEDERQETLDVEGHNDEPKKSESWNCGVCGKMFTKRSNMMTHIQSVHQGIRYYCDQCLHQSTSKTHLRRHVQRVHDGLKIDSPAKCPECDSVFPQKAAMMTHYRSKHEGTKYHCNNCEYQTGNKGLLSIHIKSIHEGVKYPCDSCDYEATTQGSLVRHIKAVHGNIKLNCLQCDFKSSRKDSLRRHMKMMHKNDDKN